MFISKKVLKEDLPRLRMPKINFTKKSFNFLFAAVLMLCLTNINLNCTDKFEWKNAADIPIISSVISTGIISYYIDSDFVPDSTLINKNFDPENIFWLDKALMSNYNKTISDISDVLLISNVLLPVIYNYNYASSNTATFMAMYFENVLSTIALTTMVKSIVRRPRPMRYYSDLPEYMLDDKDTYYSFFSGHSSISFASVVFTSELYSKLNPDSDYISYIWSLSLLSAATTATLRVLAGKHFFTDVLTGAVVGSFVGWLIPKLHEIENSPANYQNISLIRFSYRIN